MDKYECEEYREEYEEDDDNTRYTLTPKGLAYVALSKVGLLDDKSEGQFEAFWILFENDMRKFGYVQDNEELGE